MSDEYIAELITQELEESCPGEAGCHGCQSWCPKCGSVGHVCDDPWCDAHRRETDVLADMVRLDEELAREAAKARRLEIEVAMVEDELPRLAAPSWGLSPRRSTLTAQQEDDLNRRRALRDRVDGYHYSEREMMELEDELAEIRADDKLLVPRREGGRTVPRDR